MTLDFPFTTEFNIIFLCWGMQVGITHYFWLQHFTDNSHNWGLKDNLYLAFVVALPNLLFLVVAVQKIEKGHIWYAAKKKRRPSLYREWHMLSAT